MKTTKWFGIPESEVEDLLNDLIRIAKYWYSDCDPEDLAKDALIRGVPKLVKVPPKRRLAFLKTVMLRLVIDRLRSKKMKYVSLKFDPLERQQGLDSIHEDSRLQLRAEVSRLEARLRIVIEMKMNGLSTREIAHQLNIAESTVRNRYHKAIEILRRRLSE